MLIESVIKYVRDISVKFFAFLNPELSERINPNIYPPHAKIATLKCLIDHCVLTNTFTLESQSTAKAYLN